MSIHSINFAAHCIINLSLLALISTCSDPHHFPEPEKFIPERFANPDVQNSPVYLPFGSGPRLCFGMRFASTQVRLAIFYIVKNFRLSVSPNHKPFAINPAGFMLQAKDGLLINFVQRPNVASKLN